MRPSTSSSNPCRGTVSVALATSLWAFPLAVSLVQDWYVDVSSPGCPGAGTQADPFCVIMDAVNAATDGDTIHIAPGTYFENVVLDRDLSLIGTGGDQVTIVDGMGTGRTVLVTEAAVTLTGLTLSNGSAATGGGLMVDSYLTWYYTGQLLPATLVSCSVVGNSATYQGGGIYAGYADFSLVDCEVSSNTAGEDGGGIHCFDSTTISSSTITGNSAVARGGGIYGGGFTLANSSVTGNAGGGIYARAHPLRPVYLARSYVDSNLGAGIECVGICSITGSIVAGNTQDGVLFHPPACGGRDCFETLLQVENTLIVENGGAGCRGLDAQGTLANITLSENSGGGLALSGASDAVLTNTILWVNGSNAVVLQNGATASASHSLVQGGWPGIGNIDIDPLFVAPSNGNYRLGPGSPCIDAGDNHAVPPGIWTDLDGKRRFIDGTGAGLGWHRWPFVDIGAYEFGNDPPPKVRQY